MFYTTDLTLWKMYLRTELANCTSRLRASITPQNVDELQQTIVFEEDTCNDYDFFNPIWEKATKQALDKMYDYLVEYDISPTKALLICQTPYSLHKWLGFYDYDLARLIDDNQKGIEVEQTNKPKATRIVAKTRQPRTIVKDGKVNCKWGVYKSGGSI